MNSKLRRGFTIVELIIAIALLSTIMSAVMALFIVGIKNYQRESQRNFMQKEINFTADDIGIQIKQAADAPETYGSYNRDAQTLILALPAVDINDDFIYSGTNRIFDHIVFYRDGNSLKKVLIPDALSTREPKEDFVLDSVSNFSCSYSPPSETELVSCILETGRSVAGVNLKFEATKTARMRNHQ
jgi:prepilin-type N-terminal cleavage/methylation domain-containing protein